MDRKVHGSVIAAALMLFSTILVMAPAASAQSLPPQAAWQANAHQIGNDVLNAIQRVEKSDLDCQVRNLLVHRLRLLSDAITSGRGTAARGFLTAWLHNVRTMQGAQLISAEQGSAIQVQLMDLLNRVGEGWPKDPMPTRNWPKLPSCESGPDKSPGKKAVSTLSAADLNVAAASDGLPGEYGNPFTFDDMRFVIQGFVNIIPFAGRILGPLVMILWPDSGPDIYALIDEAIDTVVQEQAIQDLNNMHRTLNLFLDYEVNNPSQAGTAAIAAEFDIYAALGTFQWNHTATGGKDYRVKFLPLYAQGENLYLALLREASLHGAEWGWDQETIEIWKGKLKAQLDVDDKTQGLGYVLDTYQVGLDEQPSGSGQSDWTKRNQYVRNNTLGAMDFAEIWPYMDLYAYPNGVPNLKLTRMIYSDPVGVTDHTFTPPPYAYGPLRHLTVWVDWKATEPFIDAIQETGGPTAGPIFTGPIMGDSDLGDSPTRYDFDVAPGGANGPIPTVEGYSAMWIPCMDEYLSGLTFTFADGSSSGLLGSHFPDVRYSPLHSCPDIRLFSTTYHFSYPGEVAASVQVMGKHNFYTGRAGADSVVFGFRYADSYYPSGSAVNAQTTGCMRPLYVDVGAPVALGSILDCASNIWTYNSALHQLSTNGLCLDSDAGGAAILNDCKDGPTQRWNIIPSGVGGTIGRDGLVLTPSPSTLKLAADTGAALQRWRTPNHVQGTVQAVAAGKCLGNVSAPDSGTHMNIYACSSGFAAGQTWTYSPSMGTLSLMGGTMCLDAPGDPVSGTAVQVNVCNAEDSQQWVLLEPDARIQHVKSGLYLDLSGGNTTSATPVVLGNDTNATSQKWTWPMY
jgi:hypothetical protein